MNRAMPRGDRGHRGPDPRRESGSTGTLPRIGGLGGGIAAAGAAGWPERRKARRGWSRAGRTRGGRTLATDRVDPGAVFALGRFDLQALFLAQGGAGHIMHMLRNLSRFTINGSICSARVFPSCVECGARTGTVWFASRQKETPLPSPLG